LKGVLNKDLTVWPDGDTPLPLPENECVKVII
jgi:hypothetical protein